ncbi:peptidase inhibitor family I36 protein [Herbidospora daliensis]|uniref:peptidase inhibitor family I36 protein n=1 Tax=Herbidospora daliensis TaxID=295585 RepID=UPI0007864995|nr:peptidase inhibitor family I36 protein [Herbidospora daliensis]
MRRLIRTTLALALGTAVLGSTAAPAHAEPIEIPYLILFHHQWFQGRSIVLTQPTSHLGGDSDEATSIINNDGVAWVLYDDDSYGDRRYCIRPGESVLNLGDDRWKFNDKITSALPLESASCGKFPPFFGNG